MKRRIYFDSGTTNSRLYYIEDERLQGFMCEEIGTVNNTNECTNEKSPLLLGLYKMYCDVLNQKGILDKEIDEIYMSGMATSKTGIHEVEFLELPINLEGYRGQICWTSIPLFMRKVGFLTGIVQKPEGGRGTLENVEQFHNVRGEEIELFGIMGGHKRYFERKKTAVIMPGSHTHILYTNNCDIIGITSCMGGEMYAAMAGHTILKTSVSKVPQMIELQSLRKGYDMVLKYGINRALYITRTLALFTDASEAQRNSYLEGVVNAGVVSALKADTSSSQLDYIVIAGAAVYYDVFRPLLEECGVNAPVIKIFTNGEASFALSGMQEILAISNDNNCGK